MRSYSSLDKETAFSMIGDNSRNSSIDFGTNFVSWKPLDYSYSAVPSRKGYARKDVRQALKQFVKVLLLKGAQDLEFLHLANIDPDNFCCFMLEMHPIWRFKDNPQNTMLTQLYDRTSYGVNEPWLALKVRLLRDLRKHFLEQWQEELDVNGNPQN